MASGSGLGRDLDAWLAPFLNAMGRKTRREWAPFYLRGLLRPGERKSVQPMAVRLGLGGHDQLQHFVASPAWSDGPLWTALGREADRLVGGKDAFLVIDDTALPKKGMLSVGVARQYCGQLGKQANCQSLVSLTLAQAEVPVPVPVGLRLFLPDQWVSDPQRCAGQACRRPRWSQKPRARSPWPNWIAWHLQVCGSAACWPTRATAQVLRSGMASTNEGCCGRWALPRTRGFMAKT